MMDYIINTLDKNGPVFRAMLSELSEQEYRWREQHDKWNLLEVVCHLFDEEREDFRSRLKSILESPDVPFISIDPVGWVKERNYAEQNYELMLQKFLNERVESVKWLHSLKNPAWENAYNHPKVGPVTARFMMTNWVAHDYLHIRQITRIRYNYLREVSGQQLNYAGDW